MKKTNRYFQYNQNHHKQKLLTLKLFKFNKPKNFKNTINPQTTDKKQNKNNIHKKSNIQIKNKIKITTKIPHNNNNTKIKTKT